MLNFLFGRQTMSGEQGTSEASNAATRPETKLHFECGILVKNGHVERVRGTAYEPDSEKPFGAWAQVTLPDGNEYFHSFSLVNYTGKLEKAPYIALAKVMEEAKIGDAEQLQEYCKRLLNNSRTR